MAIDQSISIDVVSDVVCPWCFLGQKRLDKAIAASPGIDVTVRWRPFQLDATIPAQGLDRKAYMSAKFRDENALADAHRRLTSLGTAEGIDFAFEAITVSPNTLDAHRLIRWAGAAGGEIQNDLVRSLFSLYFEQGRNIGDPVVLIDAARAAGMDATIVESLLPTDADREAVATEAATASRMGITGVPCFLLEGKYAVMGAQDTATLADAIRQISEAKARGELQAG